jgi:3-oxoacyl-[acyl-carrier protein] reductase
LDPDFLFLSVAIGVYLRTIYRAKVNRQMSILKTALVTGGSRGIGRATSLALARDGYEVWINYLQNEVAAEETATLISERGGVAHLLPFDVSNAQAVREGVGALLKQSQLHVLVHNAGVVQREPVAMMKDEVITRTMGTNLESFFFLVRAVTRSMIRLRGGRIVVLSSIAGLRGLPGQSCYAASKAGVIAATQSLAQELGRFNILVNAVAPGLIDTEMNNYLSEEERPAIPLGRAGTPEEVAEVISFLCSERASYMSGVVIPVTGGLPT